MLNGTYCNLPIVLDNLEVFYDLTRIAETSMWSIFLYLCLRKISIFIFILMIIYCHTISDKSTVRQRKNVRMEALDKTKNQGFKSVSISFVLHSFIVQLESRNRPLAELSLTEARFQLSQYPSTTMINIQLLNLVLADARANLGSKLDFILASHKGAHINKCPMNQNADDPIIEFSYEISSLPRSTSQEHKAKLVFSELDVIANQETLIELLSFLRPILSDNSPPQTDTKTDTSHITKYELLDISVFCKAVSILLIKISSQSDTENRFAESVGKIFLSHLNLHMRKNGSFLSSTIRIKSVNIEDISTPDSVHRKILTLTTGTAEVSLDIGASLRPGLE